MDVDRACSQDTFGDLGAAGLSTHVVVLPPTMAIAVPADGGHCEDLASFCERAGVAVAEVMATLEVKDMAGLLALERDSAEAALGQMQTQDGHNASRSPQVRGHNCNFASDSMLGMTIEGRVQLARWGLSMTRWCIHYYGHQWLYG